MREFWNAVVAEMERYRPTVHPFYTAWAAGQLDRNDIAGYAGEFKYQIDNLRICVEEFSKRLPESQLRTAVQRILTEDRSSRKQEWSQIPKLGGGATPGRSEYSNPALSIQVVELVKSFTWLAKNGKHADVLAGFYAYESQLARMARENVSLLRKWSVLDSRTCAFLVVNGTSGLHNSQVWCEHLNQILVQEPYQARAALMRVEEVTRSIWRLLNAANRKRKMKCNVVV